MKKYKHIVCPVDLTEHSEKVIQQAIDFQPPGSKISLVHFIEPLPLTAYSIGNMDKDIESGVESELITMAEKHGLGKDNVHVVFDHPKRAINDFAKEVNADLIVIGHGRHNLIGQLLGSTASAVANRTPCDVFIIKS